MKTYKLLLTLLISVIFVHGVSVNAWADTLYPYISSFHTYDGVSVYCPVEDGIVVQNNTANTMTGNMLQMSPRKLNGTSYYSLDSSDTCRFIISNSQYYVGNWTGQIKYRTRVGGTWSSYTTVTVGNADFTVNGVEYIQIQAVDPVTAYRGFHVKLYINGTLAFISPDNAYQLGYTSGYNTGYNTGVQSVDTQAYYNSGYSDGYNAGYERGSEDSSSGSSSRNNWIYYPLDSFTISDRSGGGSSSGYCFDINNVFRTFSYQDIYDLTRQALTNGSYLFNAISGKTVNAYGVVGFYIPSSYNTFYIHSTNIPKGAKLVISIQSNVLSVSGNGQSGSYYGMNPDGTQSTIIYNYPSYQIKPTPISCTVSKIRMWSHGGDNFYCDSDGQATLNVSGSGGCFISSPLTKDSSIFDFQIYDSVSNGMSSPYVYYISVGYLCEDKSANILDKIFDLLSGGDSDTPSVIDNANSALTDFNSKAGEINNFEDQMINSFESSHSSINSAVSNFSFGTSFLTCASWVANQMNNIYTSDSNTAFMYIFPMLFGIGIFFIGGGFPKKGGKH